MTTIRLLFVNRLVADKKHTGCDRKSTGVYGKKKRMVKTKEVKPGIY